MNNMEISIPFAEYRRLIRRDAELSALEAGGVDNWEWYSDSLATLEEDE